METTWLYRNKAGRELSLIHISHQQRTAGILGRCYPRRHCRRYCLPPFRRTPRRFPYNTRSKIVQRETLNKLAVEIGLDKLVKYSTRCLFYTSGNIHHTLRINSEPAFTPSGFGARTARQGCVEYCHRRSRRETEGRRSHQGKSRNTCLLYTSARYTDKAIGKFVEYLKTLPQYDETLIVITCLLYTSRCV